MPRQTRSQHRLMRPLLALVLAATVVTRAEAQQVVGSPFPIGAVNVLGLATGYDGDVVATTATVAPPPPFSPPPPSAVDGPVGVLWYDGGGPPALANHRLVEHYDVYELDAFVPIAPLARGDYITAWTQFPDDPFYADVKMRRLGPHGAPVGLETVIATHQLFAIDAAVAPHGDGFVVVWTDVGRLMLWAFDATSTPVGSAVEIGGTPNGAALWARGLPNGGVLVVFSGFGANDESSALVLGPDLVPVGPQFDIATDFLPTDVTVSPDGSVGVLVGRPYNPPAPPNLTELRMQVFALDGSAVTEVLVHSLPGGEITGSTAAFGDGGALLVLWGQRISGAGALLGRLFDAAGAPIGPIVGVAAESRPQKLHITRRKDGRFFAAWRNENTSRGAIISICAAGSSVCGDGAVSTTCEVCDAGAANSDVVPDACRSDCRPARCGDGVTDTGESCDDGNLTACDGCNPFCESEAGTVCGDGVIAPPACGEQCDDGNVVAGDGCAPTCSVERAPGGGSPTTDCWAAWHLENPSNVPLYDKHGFISAKQACRDNDAGCDFDGGVAGSCTFHVGVCVNNSEPSGCLAARLQSWTIRTPSEKQALAKPALAAARAALSAAVVPNVVGSGDLDDCSPPADVVVPLRGTPGAYKSGKLTIKTVATLYSGLADKDALLLRCEP